MACLCKVARAVVNVPLMIRIGKTYSNRNSSTYNPSETTLYDCRKRSPGLPNPDIEIALQFPRLEKVPTGVFRCTSGECLGPCAGKESCYKNPEYFSFHDMSFFDLNLAMKDERQKQPDTKRKPISF
ncbi:NADH dehydrogenase [ubiquinone] flavoprotein 3, mitochondrial domain-containing protein [Phthorimaea operculella]|nr:NADH dehydrogenase [ubiquinone] flavoprotein 3, mitochondrial domain-containing protein [Phthorimaea operculella]